MNSRVGTRARSNRWRVVGVATAMAMIVAACGGTDADPAAEEADDPAAPAADAAAPAGDTVEVVHYFSDTLGQEAVDELIAEFETESGTSVAVSPMEHEAFKDSILVQLAGGNPPDLFSYWAGALTQFVVGQGAAAPIADVWDANGFDELFPGSLADAAVYDGERYLLPFGYHYAGMFYNPSVLEAAGITQTPESWDDFLAMNEQLLEAGVTPIALGSSARWPAQFWFDYLLLRTAGPDYRADLMAGNASYTDPEVAAAFDLWAELMEADHFVADPNAYDWTDAADQVANGDAAMTLMGTWITGYWDGNGLEAGSDYDFFPFPAIESEHADAAVGPIDGFLMAAGASNPDGAAELLAFLARADVQQRWAAGQGALPPNQQADTSGFSPVMQKALEVVGSATSFNFNYDLATEPEMAQRGLDLLAEFVNDPSGRTGYLQGAQQDAERIFAGS